MNISKLTARLQPIIAYLKRYSVILFALFFLGMYGFLVYRINVLTNSEPDAAAVDESINTVKRLKIDQSSIDKMLQLEEENIEVQSLFQQARENPFTE
jgi:hypothetical protein